MLINSLQSQLRSMIFGGKSRLKNPPSAVRIRAAKTRFRQIEGRVYRGTTTMASITKLTTLIGLIAGIGIGQAQASEWQLVEDSSTVRFIGVQEGSGFRGRFENFTATIVFDPANPSDGKIIGVVKMDSAKTGDAERDATLLEPDWFDPENHPESRFESESIEALDDGTYAAHGTLTIIGNSNPVTLTFEFDVDGSSAEFSGGFDILRLDFGVGWDATNWIDDEVGVQIELDLQQ